MRKLVLLNARDVDFLNYRRDVCTLLKQQGFQITIACSFSGKKEEIQKLGFECVDFETPRKSLNLFRFFSQVLHLRQILKTEKPNYLLSYSLKLCLVARLASVVLPIKHVGVFTGMGYLFTDPGFKAKVLKNIFIQMSRLLFSGTQIAVLNPADLDLVRGLGISQHVSLIPGEGIDPARFSSEPEVVSDLTQITYVGRFLKDKGLFELVKVGEELERRKVNFRINLVGEVDPENPNSLTREDCRELAKHSFLSFQGFRSDIQKVWAEAHIAILLSYREGLPQSLLEAALCRRVIVASNISACRQIIDTNKNGILVDIQNTSGIADSIEHLIKNPLDKTCLVEAAYQKVKKDFSAEKVSNELIRLLEATST